MYEAENQILEVFWWFDDKGQGLITGSELARVLKSLSPDWKDEHVERLVQLADTNSDGLIKYREFVSWLMGSSDDYKEAQLACLQPKASPADVRLSALEAKQLEAEVKANQIARDSALAERAAVEANELLEAALPALDAATEALERLCAEDLAALAAASAPPPPAVAAVAASVCALRPLGRRVLDGGGSSEGSWAEAQALLSAEGLLSALCEFDKDSVKAEQVDEVRRLLRADGMSDSSLESMQAMSAAGHVLLLWVRAVVRYFDAARAAAPKFQLVNTLHRSMWRAEAELTRINEEVEAMMA